MRSVRKTLKTSFSNAEGVFCQEVGFLINFYLKQCRIVSKKKEEINAVAKH